MHAFTSVFRPRALSCVCLLGCFLWSVVSAFGAALINPDFETGDLQGWSAQADGLTIAASTNLTFNRNYAARMSGSFASSRWVTNTLFQTVAVNPGDKVTAEGFVYWKQNGKSTAAATGYVQAALSGAVSTSIVWSATNQAWTYFNLGGGLFGVSDGGFESGTLDAWTKGLDSLAGLVQGVTVDQGLYAFKMFGTWNGWNFNQVYQTFNLSAGDLIEVHGRLNVVQLQATMGWAMAGLKLEQEGGSFSAQLVVNANTNNTGWLDLVLTASIPTNGVYDLRCMVCGDVTSNGTATAEVYFDQISLKKKGIELTDGGFESGNLSSWSVGCDNLIPLVTNTVFYEGSKALRVRGGWTNKWSFNTVHQLFHVSSSTVVEARGKLYLQSFTNTAGWVMAGLKLEKADGTWSAENTYDQTAAKGSWLNLSVTAAITNPGDYYCRCMICGDVTTSGTATVDAYFDGMQLWQQGASSNGSSPSSVTLSLAYTGYSGGTGNTSSVDAYFDGFTLNGSTANLVPATNIFTSLKNEASAIATNPAVPIPDVNYPFYFTYGYPGGDPTNLNYPSYVEAIVQGYYFRHLSNNVALSVTNTIHVYSITGAGDGFIEFDQYSFVDKFWHNDRGSPVDIGTNAPFFRLGTRDNSSAEFGNGPFPAVATYVVGTSLTNFPRRMTTDASGGWPSTLNIVFPMNFSQHSLSRDMYCVLATVPTNGPASNIKMCRLGLNVGDGKTNILVQSQEIHMGWATEKQSYGMVDYPNVTYQDHNLVDIRNPSKYALAEDGTGWFVHQWPRGSATIEPMALYALKNGNWVQHIYEEYLSMWPSAASGVRSIFDDDTQIRLDGKVSYDISYKLGHTYGTNEFGDSQYWQLFEARGNGYYRMTDYEGFMAGSFRPMAANLFSLYGVEDPFLMPKSYTRIVPRTTPTNQVDNSYVESFVQVRSKTNQMYIGALETDFHLTPDEVAASGAYFDMDEDTWANQALIMTNSGKLCLFAQSSMHWRGDVDFGINNLSEAHDIDAVMVHKSDGEWITHQVLNPPANVYHLQLCSFGTGDVIYLQQQDRGTYSYGYTPEAPYQKASSFEITLMDDPGRPVSVDIYQQHTIDEFADNVVIACNLNTNLALGEHVHSKYRYRTKYAPGVVIAAPNESSGGENWSNNLYHLVVYATDGDEMPLQANLYYGNGLDSNWKLINTAGPLNVPSDTWTVAYNWDVSAVTSGAYYLKATAQRTTLVAKVGFDVSNTRLQIGSTIGFPNNAASNVCFYLGNDMSFESGSKSNWNKALTNWNEQADQLAISVTNLRAASGSYSCRMNGPGWTNWSWNAVYQEIPCKAGEGLQVVGQVYIASLGSNAGSSAVCGIKMEPTNGSGGGVSVEFDQTAKTGTWLNVNFTRLAPVTGTDRLMFYVCGTGATNVDVSFDSLAVISTNRGPVTGAVNVAYWRAVSPVDVRAQNILSLWARGSYGYSNLEVWANDSVGVTNSVRITNYVTRLSSADQQVGVPWTNFPGLDRSRISTIGYRVSAASNDICLSRIRSTARPLLIQSKCTVSTPGDLEGIPLFEPGNTVTNVITIQNVSGGNLTGLLVQAVQEYAETRLWLDQPDGQPPWWSAKTRRGERLCGNFEQRWTNVSVAAGQSVVLTNVYVLPFGKLVVDPWDPTVPNWYVDRNYEARSQVHLMVRDASGNGIYDDDGVGFYSMDDDFDIDNDGLPDAWEIQYFGSRTAGDPNADSDGDGYSNLQEYLAGTDPLNANSHPVSPVLTVRGNPTNYGTASPYNYGSNSIPSNTVVSESVTPAIDQSNGYGRVCVGWTGSGNVPTSGVDHFVTFTIFTNSTLTWNWAQGVSLAQQSRLFTLATQSVVGSQIRLAASGLGTNDHFGDTVAIDGDYAVVGAPYQAVSTNASAGAAYVFRRSGTNWIQEARLQPGDGATPRSWFGCAVSINSTNALVGRYGDGSLGATSGSAYVYSRIGTNWLQQGRLRASDGAAGDCFGSALSICGDYSLIGAYGDAPSGSVYVFQRSGTNWSQKGKLAASDAASGDGFGYALQVWSNYLVASSPWHDDVNTNSGSVYVFVRTGSNWTQQTKLISPSPSYYGAFGRSVAIDGDFLIVGEDRDFDYNAARGSAYVFHRSGTNWVLEERLVDGTARTNTAFGSAVDIGDGYAVVGACGESNQAGAAYFYERRGSIWRERERFVNTGSTPYHFGVGVAYNGGRLLVGGATGTNGPAFLYTMATDTPLAVTWCLSNTYAGTITAPATLTTNGLNYTFREWQLDGVRQIDGSGNVLNPATSIWMPVPRTIQALYNPVPTEVYYMLGAENQSDLDFLQAGYPGSPLDLDATMASGFPKEVNDSWWTQYFFMTLNAAQASRNMQFTLKPYWNDGSGTLTVSLDHWNPGISDWESIAQTNISGTIDGLITMSASKLVTGRNDFRFRGIGGTNGTHAITWDQIIIKSL